MPFIKKVAIFLVSTGWLLPLLLSFSFFNSWATHIVMPSVYGKEIAMHSFPYYESSYYMFRVAFGWLSLVVCSWSYYLIFVFYSKNQKDHVG